MSTLQFDTTVQQVWDTLRNGVHQNKQSLTTLFTERERMASPKVVETFQRVETVALKYIVQCDQLIFLKLSASFFKCAHEGIITELVQELAGGIIFKKKDSLLFCSQKAKEKKMPDWGWLKTSGNCLWERPLIKASSFTPDAILSTTVFIQAYDVNVLKDFFPRSSCSSNPFQSFEAILLYLREAYDSNQKLPFVVTAGDKHIGKQDDFLYFHSFVQHGKTVLCVVKVTKVENQTQQPCTYAEGILWDAKHCRFDSSRLAKVDQQRSTVSKVEKAPVLLKAVFHDANKDCYFQVELRGFVLKNIQYNKKLLNEMCKCSSCTSQTLYMSPSKESEEKTC